MFDFLKKKTSDTDAMVLMQLREAGSDLSKPHLVDFFLYFSDESAANNVKSIIQKQHPEDIITVERSAADDFLCQVQRSMIPTLEALQETGRQFDELSSQFGGIYDGWGAEIVNFQG